MNDIGKMRAIYPSLRGRRVLVTGGGSGIGAGIVEGFARQGADVIFFDIAEEASKNLARRCGARFECVDLKMWPKLEGSSRRWRRKVAPLTCWSTTPQTTIDMHSLT